MTRRRITWVVAILPLLLIASGCASAGTALAQKAGKAAFVEAVNLHCRSTKARIEIAGKIAKIAAETDQGKQMTADAQVRAEAAKDKAQSLIDQIGKLAGPTGLQDDLISGFKKLREIPGQMADGNLTKDEGLAQIEKTRADLRAKGFTDCV